MTPSPGAGPAGLVARGRPGRAPGHHHRAATAGPGCRRRQPAEAPPAAPTRTRCAPGTTAARPRRPPVPPARPPFQAPPRRSCRARHRGPRPPGRCRAAPSRPSPTSDGGRSPDGSMPRRRRRPGRRALVVGARVRRRSPRRRHTAIRPAGRHASAPGRALDIQQILKTAQPSVVSIRPATHEPLRQRRVGRGDLQGRPDPHQRPRDRAARRQIDGPVRATAAGRRPRWSAAPRRRHRARSRPTAAAPCRRTLGLVGRRCRSATTSSPSATPSTSAATPSVTEGIVSAKDRAHPDQPRHARPPHPDRRRHQPRQLRWAAAQRRRPGGRHQHRHHRRTPRTSASRSPSTRSSRSSRT